MNKPKRENVVQEVKSSNMWIVYLLVGLFITAYVYENHQSLFGKKAGTTDMLVDAQPEQPAATPQQTAAQLFYAATAAADLGKMRMLLTQLQPGEINTVTNGMTPIMTAASQGNVQVMDFLLANGANPNKRGAMERTALQYAAERNQLEAAKLLIKHGADINGTDNTRLSPLVMAADRRYQELALYLIEQGADVNLQHVQGWTALIDAARNGDLVLVTRLVESGADLNAKTGNGWTALDYARHNKHSDIEKYLSSQRSTRL